MCLHRFVVEDRILNGYNNSAVTTKLLAMVVEDRILNGYNNSSTRTA